MKKMRDTDAVSYIMLVDSSWMPKTEMETFRSIKSFGLKDHIKVKSSADEDPLFEPIDVRKFKNKNEFIGYMVKSAMKAWDDYEAKSNLTKRAKIYCRTSTKISQQSKIYIQV